MKVIKLEGKELEFLSTLDTISIRKYLKNKYRVPYNEHIEFALETKPDKIKEQGSRKLFIEDKLKEELK